MKQTAVEWLIKCLKGQKNDPFNYEEWSIAFEYAKEMEKEQTKQIREMLMQGALTNMSCASAIVELDKITKSE